MKIIVQMGMRLCKLVRHLDRPVWGQKGVKKKSTVLDKLVK